MIELVRVRSNSEHRIERIKDAAGAAPAQQAAAARRTSRRCSSIEPSAERDAENGFIVVTQVGSQTFGIVVDGVFHTEEIVVKPMSSKLRHIAMFSGNTILGDGAVIMIIDPNGVAQAIGSAGDRAAGRRGSAPTPQHAAADERTTSLLVFRAGSPQPKAVPLVAGHAARGDRRPQDRAVERPPHGAVSRPADAAGAA